ncbi:selenide, water dikinase SelD [soil metagenome]
MHRALATLPRYPPHPDVLVGHETFDDAGVYRLADDLALIQTIDFFTPIVDDPYDYGQIAAANALSDVYAMGGTPRTALNLVCWPPSGLDPDVLGAILAGGADKAHEAECALIGGHSIQDEELKYGLAVTGTAHPERLLTNTGARSGDVLILTKPLGTGILTTALKRGAVAADAIAVAVAAMKSLNGPAMRAALAAGVRSATDITGFGLAGHGVQLADASGVTLEIEAARLPLFEGAVELALADHIPGGGRSNREYFGRRVAIADGVPEALRIIAFDPQTSGGLLLAAPAEKAEQLLNRLHESGVQAAHAVGVVSARGDAPLVLT